MGTKPILVTGATGFLGLALARSLRAKGLPVRTAGRNAAALQGLFSEGLDPVAVDLAADPHGSNAALDHALRGIGTVVHCAALSSAWGARAAFARANIEGTRALVAAAGRAGVARLVLISSSSVTFAFRDQIGVTEAMDLPPPVNAYAWSKAEAERIVRSADGLATTILRPRGLYGAGDTALLPRLLQAARRGPLPLFRGGRARIDLTHVEDAVAAIETVLEQPEATAGRLYNVSGGEPLPVRTIVEAAAAAAGQGVSWRAVPWPVAFAALRAREALHRAVCPDREPRITAYAAGLFAFSQTLDLTRIAEDTGWRPGTGFAEGLRKTFTASG